MVRLLSSYVPNPSIPSNYPHRYISAGSTQGNPYGLCVICAVCFPLFFFARLYCPVPPMLSIVFGVTTCLVRIFSFFSFVFFLSLLSQVIGYSFQDQYIPSPASPGHGWSVFWVRSHWPSIYRVSFSSFLFSGCCR